MSFFFAQQDDERHVGPVGDPALAEGEERSEGGNIEGVLSLIHIWSVLTI